MLKLIELFQSSNKIYKLSLPNLAIAVLKFRSPSVEKFTAFRYYLSLVVKKAVFGVSEQVQHKPGCTAIEDG